MKVLVTTYRTASDRIALAAIRGLALAGHEAWIGTDDRSTPACASRFVQGLHDIPSPIVNPLQHADRVKALVRQERFDTVLPTDDYAVYALSYALEAGDWPVRIPVPSLSAQQTAQNKPDASRLAASLGLAVPPSQEVRTDEDLENALSRLPAPWIIKLRCGGGGVGQQITDDPDTARSHFIARPRHSDAIYDFQTLLVQSYIRGKTQDACLLMNHGRPVRSLASRRVLTTSPTGGSGILTETIARPAFFDQAVALLEALNWHGPADVEFLIDQDDGTAYFIEVNGRLWGTTGLSVAAGVNFPARACEMAVKGHLPPQLTFPEDYAMRFPLPGGFEHVARSSAKLRAAWQLFGPSRSTDSDIWLTDPKPAFRQICQAWKMRSQISRAETLSPLPVVRDLLENSNHPA